MNLFGPRSGSWSLWSDEDHRWRANGNVNDLVIMAGMHPDAVAKIKELEIKYGPAPADLEYACMKD